MNDGTPAGPPQASESLAGKDFWEHDYLGDVGLPALPDPELRFDRELAKALARFAPTSPGAGVLEVGCAPAKWLAFYAREFAALPVGIEYTPVGADLSRRNLAALGIDGEIIEGDFFTVPAVQADLVLSLGFIEHFDDLEGVFRRHLEFVRPGGLLVVGVPNYRGLLGMVQRLSDPEHLAMHNRAAMRPEFFRAACDATGVELVSQHLLDGPDHVILTQGRRRAYPLLAALLVLNRLPGIERLNHPLLSAYLLNVIRRPG